MHHARASRLVIALGLSLGLASGCGTPTYEPSGSLIPTERDIPSRESLVPGLTADPSTLPAADPSLPGFDGWPLAFRTVIPLGVSLRCELEIRRGMSALATIDGTMESGRCTGLWDGLAVGVPATPGPLSVEARLLRSDGTVRARAAQTVEVVRLGIDQIDVDGAAGERHPLLFRRLGGRADGFHELRAADPVFGLAADVTESGASALELASGARRAIPAPWNDVMTPPVDRTSADGVEHDVYDLPAALVAGSRPTLLARIATMAAGGVSGDATDAEIRVVAPMGLTLSGEDGARHGNLITLAHQTSPVPGVGRFDVPYTFTFEARAMGGEFQPIPGELTITLRYYGLVDVPSFYSNTIPHRPWVDVVDRIAEWVGGTTADPDMVASRIVEGVFYELGLRYDTARGASFYADYSSFNFGGGSIDLQAFEERDFGTTVNCSDSAGILSTYANMVGLDFRYHILEHRFASGFDLNYIQAIGVGRFDDTPFDTGRGGFSYHAIVGARDGTTWDATLAVDGDGAPAASPNTLRLVQGLGAREYLDALSSEAANIVTTHDAHVRIL